jgi:hypothetical protein
MNQTEEQMPAIGEGAVYALAEARWHLIQTGRVTWPRRDGYREWDGHEITAYRLVDGSGKIVAEEEAR